MNASLLAVGAAAVCSGAAAVLQASAVARLPTATAVSGGFVLRLLRSPRYLGALALVAAGFGLSFLALRHLPLFVVQAGRASSLAVTAVLSVLVLRVRLRRTEAVAVLVIGTGLVLVGITAGDQAAAEVNTPGRLVLLAAALVLLPVTAAVVRMRARSGLLLAVLAGGCYGLLALGARILRGFDPGVLLADPAAWAMAIAGALGLLCGAMALQRASVVTVTSAMVAVETLLGSVLGMLVCGDRPTPGLAVPAALGFALVLAGALALARFGAPEPDAGGHEEPAALPIG